MNRILRTIFALILVFSQTHVFPSSRKQSPPKRPTPGAVPQELQKERTAALGRLLKAREAVQRAEDELSAARAQADQARTEETNQENAHREALHNAHAVQELTAFEFGGREAQDLMIELRTTRQQRDAVERSNQISSRELAGLRARGNEIERECRENQGCQQAVNDPRSEEAFNNAYEIRQRLIRASARREAAERKVQEAEEALKKAQTELYAAQEALDELNRRTN